MKSRNVFCPKPFRVSNRKLDSLCAPNTFALVESRQLVSSPCNFLDSYGCLITSFLIVVIISHNPQFQGTDIMDFPYDVSRNVNVRDNSVIKKNYYN